MISKLVIIFLAVGCVNANHTEHGCVQEIRNRYGNITTPRSSGAAFLECEWQFRFPKYSVKLEFLTFEIPRSESDLCGYAYVMYGTYDYMGRKVVQDKVCGGTAPKPYIVTTGHAWLTYVYTGGTDVPHKHFRGFVIQYRIYMSEHQVNQIYVAIVCGLVIPLSCCVPFFLYVRKLRNQQRKKLDEEHTMMNLKKKEQLRRMLVPIKRHDWRQMSIRRKLLTKAVEGGPNEQPCKRRRLMLPSQGNNDLTSPVYAEIPVFEDPSYVNPEDVHRTSATQPTQKLSVPSIKRGRNGLSLDSYSLLKEGQPGRSEGDNTTANTYMSLCGMSTSTMEQRILQQKSNEALPSTGSVSGLLPHEISSSTPVQDKLPTGREEGWDHRLRDGQKGKLESITELLDECSDSKTSNPSMRAMMGSKDTLEPSSAEENHNLPGKKGGKKDHVIPRVIVHSSSQSDLSTHVKNSPALVDSSTLDSSTISDPYPHCDDMSMDKNHNIVSKKGSLIRKPPSFKKKPRVPSCDLLESDSYVSTGPSNGTVSDNHTEDNVDWSFEDQRHLSLIQECLDENTKTASIETMMRSRDTPSADMVNFSVDSVFNKTTTVQTPSNTTPNADESVFRTYSKSNLDGTFINDSLMKLGRTFTVSSSGDVTYIVDAAGNRKETSFTGVYKLGEVGTSSNGSSSWELTPGFTKDNSTKTPHKYKSTETLKVNSPALNNNSPIKYLDKPPQETQYFDVTDSDATPSMPRKHLSSNTSPRDPTRLLSRDHLSTPNESMPEMICQGSLLETMYYDLSNTDMIPSNKLDKSSFNSMPFSPLEALPMLNEIELSNSLLRQRLSLSNTTLTPLNSPKYFQRFQNVTVKRPHYDLKDDNSLLDWNSFESSVNRTGTWLNDHVFVYSPEDARMKELYNSGLSARGMGKSPSIGSGASFKQHKNHLRVPQLIPSHDGSKHRAKIPIDCVGGMLCRVASFSSLDVSVDGSLMHRNLPDGKMSYSLDTLSRSSDNKSQVNDPSNQAPVDNSQSKRENISDDDHLQVSNKDDQKGSKDDQSINEDFKVENLGDLSIEINPVISSGCRPKVHDGNEKDKNNNSDSVKSRNSSVLQNESRNNRPDEKGSNKETSFDISNYLLPTKENPTYNSSTDSFAVNKISFQYSDESKSEHSSLVNHTKGNSFFDGEKNNVESDSKSALIICPKEGPSIAGQEAQSMSYPSPKFPRSLSVQELIQPRHSLIHANYHADIAHTPQPRSYRRYRSTGNVHTPHSNTFTPTLQPVVGGDKEATPTLNPYDPHTEGWRELQYRRYNSAGNFMTETAL